MAALTLNGITVPVLRDAFRELEPRRLGGFSRGVSGQAISTVRGVRRRWAGSLVPRPSSEMQAWRGLIEGLGDSWPMNASPWGSARGRQPTSITGASSVAGKWSNALRLAAVTGQITLPIGATDWTVAVWRNAGSGFQDWLITSAGAKWLNGATTAASSGWLVVTSSTLQVITAGFAQSDLDDLVFWPFKVPSSWAAALYTERNARAWTAQPHLRATGDLLQSEVKTAIGRVTGVRSVAMMSGGAIDHGGEQIDFELEEAT